MLSCSFTTPYSTSGPRNKAIKPDGAVNCVE